MVVRAALGLYAASSFLVAVVWAVRLALLTVVLLAASIVQAVLGFAVTVIDVLGAWFVTTTTTTASSA